MCVPAIYESIQSKANRSKRGSASQKSRRKACTHVMLSDHPNKTPHHLFGDEASKRTYDRGQANPLFGKNQLVDFVELHLPQIVGDSKPGEIHAAGHRGCVPYRRILAGGVEA